MTNESPDAEIAKLAEHAASEKYQKAFRYRKANRPSRSIDDVSTMQLGHMLDSFNDALIFMQRMADNPQINVYDDPAYEPLKSVEPIPQYLTSVSTDPRNATSYFRTDIDRQMDIKKEPDLADLSNRIHGILRQQASYIGQIFVMPEHIKPLFSAYKDVIDRYADLLDKYKNPETKKRDYTKIPVEEMKAYTAAFEPVANTLFSAFRKLKTAEVIIDGKTYSLPNDKPINDRLEDSFPALILFGVSIFSKGIADRNKRPGKLEFEDRFRKILGAESLIADTEQFLDNLLKSIEPSLKLPDFDRAAIKNILPLYKRSLQIALAFCKTADCGYDKIYEDMELFINMAGAKADLGNFQTPQETAMMLYAVDRRFARAGKEKSLQKKMRHYADEIGAAEMLSDLPILFGNNNDFRQALADGEQLAKIHDMANVTNVLDQIKSLTQITKCSATN